MGKFVDFCKEELERAGLFSEEDFYGGMTGEAVLELCRVFEKQGHSGMSASIAGSLFNTLRKWEPIKPLTGEDDEWTKISDGFFQNKRCPSVFKENGEAYQVDYYIFIDKTGGGLLPFPILQNMSTLKRRKSNGNKDSLCPV